MNALLQGKAIIEKHAIGRKKKKKERMESIIIYTYRNYHSSSSAYNEYRHIRMSQYNHRNKEFSHLKEYDRNQQTIPL